MKIQFESDNDLNKRWITNSILPKQGQVACPSVLVETIYTMPNWVVGDITFRRKWSKSQISQMCQKVQKNQSKCEKAYLTLQPMSGEVTFRLTGNVLPKIASIDAQSGKSLSNSKLKQIFLKKKNNAGWRRELMVAVSEMLLQAIESHELDENNRSKFLKTIDDPVTAEAEALKVWNNFVDECGIPSSFLVSTRSPLSLYELMTIRSGNSPETRQIFANKIPWVARSVLKSNKRDKQIRKIDANLENFNKIANKYICCSNLASCYPARKLAEKLTCNQNSTIGQLDDILDEPVYRRILVKAHEADHEIISQIGKNASLAKRQIGWASEVYDPYKRYVAENSRFAPLNLSTLLARLMIRNGYELDFRFCPETIVKGFLAVSLDSFATFATERFGGSLDGENAFNIDVGVAAFVYFIGKKNPPLLTIHQLIEFSNKAIQCHQRLRPNQIFDLNWSPPTEWDSTIQKRLDQMEIKTRVVTDRQSLFRHWTRSSILPTNYLYHSGVLGKSVLFLIDATDGQATLKLQPIFNVDETVILDWEQSKLSSCQDDGPGSTCEFAAAEILKHFQKQCPKRLSREELERRTQTQLAIDSRKYVTSESVARWIWKEFYAKNLPHIFAKTDPKSVLTEYASDTIPRSEELCLIDDAVCYWDH